MAPEHVHTGYKNKAGIIKVVSAQADALLTERVKQLGRVKPALLPNQFRIKRYISPAGQL